MQSNGGRVGGECSLMVARGGGVQSNGGRVGGSAV